MDGNFPIVFQNCNLHLLNKQNHSYKGRSDMEMLLEKKHEYTKNLLKYDEIRITEISY